MKFSLTHQKKSLIFILLIILLTFASFYQAFNLSFIIDDWFLLWGALYDKTTIYPFFQTHPNVAYQFILLAPLFKFNPLYYQVVGFILKIIDSLVISLLIFSITKSKQSAVFSGLIFASSVVGIEAFTRVAANYAALLIPTICLGLYFWISAREKYSLPKYLLSTFFILLTIIGNPGIGIIILPTIFLWEIFQLIIKFDEATFKRFLTVTVFLITIFISLKWYLDPRIAERNDTLINNINLTLNHFPSVAYKFSASIGNLLIGWIIPVEELNHLSDPNFLTAMAGSIFFVTLFILIFLLLRKKSDSLRIALFFGLLIVLFYFPGWFTQSFYFEHQSASAVSNRYFTISNVGLVGLMTYLISFVVSKYRVAILLAIIILNLWSSWRILSWESIYHSTATQNYLYEKIDKDLPKGDEKSKILLFTGDHWIRIALDWNDFYPLALKRGIIRKSEFSEVTNDLNRVKELVCARDENTPPKFRLSNLYGWDVGSGDIYNVSKQLRSIISNDKECQFTP